MPSTAPVAESAAEVILRGDDNASVFPVAVVVTGIVAFTRIKETQKPTPPPKAVMQPAPKNRK